MKHPIILIRALTIRLIELWGVNSIIMEAEWTRGRLNIFLHFGASAISSGSDKCHSQDLDPNPFRKQGPLGEHAPPQPWAPLYVFTSDGSVARDAVDAPAGCALVKLLGPAWGGSRAVPLRHSTRARSPSQPLVLPGGGHRLVPGACAGPPLDKQGSVRWPLQICCYTQRFATNLGNVAPRHS